jgi:hypothetical protein
MDFLKEIVKEIGDDYTKLARDIDDTEKYVDTLMVIVYILTLKPLLTRVLSQVVGST